MSIGWTDHEDDPWLGYDEYEDQSAEIPQRTAMHGRGCGDHQRQFDAGHQHQLRHAHLYWTGTAWSASS